MTTPITPAVQAALGVANASMRKGASSHGPASTIVLDLYAAGLLQSTETAAELALLRARLAELKPYETLQAQACPDGQHRGWFADAPGPLACPWCEISRLESGRGEVYRAYRDGSLLGTYATMAGAEGACERALLADYPDAASDWLARPDGSGVLDLITHHWGHTSATGLYVVLEQVLGEDAAAVTA